MARAYFAKMSVRKSTHLTLLVNTQKDELPPLNGGLNYAAGWKMWQDAVVGTARGCVRPPGRVSMGTFALSPFLSRTPAPPHHLCPRSQVGHAIGVAGRRPCHARRRSPCPRSANPQSSSRETPSLPVRLPCQTCLPPRPVVRHGASRAPERGVLVRRWSKHGSTSKWNNVVCDRDHRRLRSQQLKTWRSWAARTP